MATVLLGVAGASLGGSLWGPIGAVIGRAAGALIGNFADRMIVNALTPPVRNEGPRLTTTDIQTSTEGSVIDRVYGRARVTGQVIWATRFEEEVDEDEVGGKGGGPKVVTTTYSYFGNFAVGLCEGPIAGIGRLWADGKELDQTDFEFRVHRGTETQDADPLIEAKEGDAPAYRGLAYIVFERMPLEGFGNRLPQIAAEVFRPTGDLEEMIQGVAIIGGNEFGYDPEEIVKVDEDDGGEEVNRHTLIARTDWTASLDRLGMLAPELKSVMLVVPWFGDDLRAGSCSVRPKVDYADKPTEPYEWQVGPLTRASAQVTSQSGGSAAYGGSPADKSVIRAIRDLAERDLKVTLCPFLMMDIAASNTKPNPYSANAATNGQPAYPWRGRITPSPAPGFAGSVDKTSAAAAQIASFVGTCTPSHFGGSGTSVTYSGPDEWTYRRMVLHCAKLAALAGGVDTFLIGSEMVALTQARSAAGTYPFVAALQQLAADVSGMLPSAKVGYAADWSEYHSHRPGDGTGDVYFNLDPLWADGNIDFVGIDNYLPLSDWRDGTGHLDFNPAGPTTIYDAAYLDSNVEGGEHFDWYYASAAARASQTRTPIADSGYGKHWVFRQKDIRSWWLNSHKNRPGGAESASATGWTPQSKPVRFTELGCPAVDKGANQPNVFVDPKSSESFWPHFSTRARDDAMQRAWLKAMLGHWQGANNPTSTVYAGPMIDLSRSHAWCWDARPWPSFDLDGAWGDAPNWEQGHWLTGRLGTAPAAETIRAILDGAGFSARQIEPLPAVVDGVTSGNLASARAMLDALRPAYGFDAVESDGLIKVISRLGRSAVAAIAADELVAADEEGGPTWRETRVQETELPDVIKLRYGDPARDDQPGGTEARRAGGGSARTLDFSLPVIVAENLARGLAERELHSAWIGRERTSFALPPSRLGLDPGDVVSFAPTARLLRLSDLSDAEARKAEAFAVDPLGMAPVRLPRSAGKHFLRSRQLDPRVVFVDGPLLEDDNEDHAAYVGGTAKPFGPGIALFRSPSTSGYTLDTVLSRRAVIGETTDSFPAGPLWRWDRGSLLKVRLVEGSLSSAEEAQVLAGANPMLVQNGDGEWELLQFATATPTGTRAYTLSNLLRGQRGTEHAMRSPLAAGAPVVLANRALRQTDISPAMIGLALNWRYGPAAKDIGSDGFKTESVTLRAKARRPLAPVHFRAKRDPATGDWAFTWVRRTRIGGDAWDQVEVPLAEESERYRLRILAGPGGAAVRTIERTSAAYTYAAADQATDFGSAQASIAAAVAQLGATFGAGIETARSFP